MTQPLSVPAQDEDSLNRRARDQARETAAAFKVASTGILELSSAGRLLVIGADPLLVERAVMAASPLDPAALIVGPGAGSLAGATTWWSPRDQVTLDGWLGAFRLRLEGQGPGQAHFDLVLDLSGEPFLTQEMLPPGYLAPDSPDAAALDQALGALRDLVGQFEKPRYFAYDPGICAHGMKGATACRRCIDACPAGAITSLVERVQVEAALCQGGGACATSCPTGAMAYNYPSAQDNLERVRRLLVSYREAGGSGPVLLILDAEAGVEAFDRILADAGPCAGHLLPLMVEEVASLGLEVWLTALAYGARAVGLLDSVRIPENVRRVVDEQLDLGRAILAGLGYPPDALRWCRPQAPVPDPVMPALGPAVHAAVGAKRQILFAALDHLHARAERARPLVTLSAGAPFGTAQVDEKACTLCMACVTVCPGKALQHGQDVPQLKFLEANCVQCGLCTRSCPEDAIWITPRLLFDAQARGRPRLLCEDTPFHCLSCGSAFATTSLIGRMQQRLAGHSMYRDPQAAARLRLCGDCRVADMMRAQEQ